jgi:hypothetical protein
MGSWPVVADLPDPRPDGRCARCERKEAVTRDGRFCKKCLHELVVRMSPGSVVPRGINRTGEQRQGSDGGGPWGENNVRILEGD